MRFWKITLIVGLFVLRATFASAQSNCIAPYHRPDCPNNPNYQPGQSPLTSPDSSVIDPNALPNPNVMPDMGQDMGANAGDQGPQGYGYLSEGFGEGRAAYGTGAGMIGDFFGSGYVFIPDSIFSPARPSTIPIAGGDRRFKISDNNSPFPTDRVFFNYHHFANPLNRLDGQNGNLDRYTFGMEKTFLGGVWSTEFRAPIISGLSSDQVIGSGNYQSTEFGNLGFALKRLLYRGDFVTSAGGLGVILPTADNAVFTDGIGNNVLTLKNEAFYLQPFVGVMFTPTDRFYAQFNAQTDFNARGNTVYFGGTRAGVMQDQTLLYLDMSLGYWVYRNPYAYVTGLAPIWELHYTSSLNDSDIVTGTGNTNALASFSNRIDVLNMTTGLRTELRGNSFLTVGAVVPLRTLADKLFDAEVSIQYNRFF